MELLTKEQFVFPDDIITLFFKPIAKSLGMRYVPKNNKILFKNLFNKLAAKAREKSLNLEPIIQNIEDITTPLAKYAEIVGAALKPFLKLIPPEYTVIAIAIVVALIVIPILLPMRLGGVWLYYKAEEWLKIPFFKKNKKWYDNIPKKMLALKYHIEKVELIEYQGSYKDFFKLPLSKIESYIYEINIATNPVQFATLKGLLQILEMYPQNKWAEVLDTIDLSKLLNLPAIDITLNLDDIITLQAHFYSGKQRILPPILHMIIDGFMAVMHWIQNIIENMLGGMFPNASEEQLDILKTFLYGMFGVFSPILGRK